MKTESKSSAAISTNVFSVLRYANFKRMWLASVTSIQSNMMALVAASWLMTTLTDSPTLIAMVQGSITAPVMLFSIFSGVLADSFDRRRLLLIAQSITLVVVVALAALHMMGVMSAYLLLILTFMIGTGTAVNNPSWQATIGDLLPRNEIRLGVALNNISHNLARSLGPAVSGVLLIIWPVSVAFGLAAIGIMVMIITLLRWQREMPDQSLPRENFATALGTGLRYVSLAPNISSTIARASIFSFGGIAILALLPVKVTTHVDGTALTYGILLSTFGVGAMAGAFVSGAAQDKLGGERVVRIAYLAIAFSMTVIALSNNFWVIGCALPIAGAAWVNGFTTFNTTVQLSTARWVVGRVMALHQTGVFAGFTLGSYFGGALAATYGLSVALLASASVLVFGTLVGFVRPIPNVEDADVDASGQFSTPIPELDMKNRSGPIRVTITYRVPKEKSEQFFEAIATRRRARIRTGARRWALHQDIGVPEVWTESYQVQNWAEYVRHNERQTTGDQHNIEALRQFLDQEAEQPVHRQLERTPFKQRSGPQIPQI